MRAPPLLLLLLMAAAGLAVSPLARLNPWLSACDLEEEGAGGVRECRGAECGGGGGAPDVLSERDVPHLCALGAGARARRLAELRLRACCERSPASALDRSARADVLAGGERCERALHDLLGLDAMVARVHCDFVNILFRYDRDQPYSVHTCNECQVSVIKKQHHEFSTSTATFMCSKRLELQLRECIKPRQRSNLFAAVVCSVYHRPRKIKRQLRNTARCRIENQSKTFQFHHSFSGVSVSV